MKNRQKNQWDKGYEKPGKIGVWGDFCRKTLIMSNNFVKYCLRRNFGANGPNIYANVFFCVHFYFCVFLGVGISVIVVQQTLVSDEVR